MKPYHLYHSPGACSLAPHIVLEELGVAYEPIRVLVNEGENRKPEYLAVNPRGRVPALVIDDEHGQRILTEALAIMVYLTRRHPQPSLLPTEPEGHARALEWMSWLASIMHQGGVRTVFRPERFTTDPAGAPAIAEQGRINLRPGYDDIEARLSGRTWALGDAFSAIDAYLLVFYRWGNRCGLRMRETCPEYSRVMDAVRARPAVQRVVAREGIHFE
ncbi:glutathione S-transferase family protein [Panacagrimonas sp.]|uniref:glutathione S-transferase family protein n=1 Tax=Panacagrimonas sp. TaxID=2480088 RepID=UPI003B51792B